MKKSFSYRQIILVCTFLTGTTGLVFQVVWQKYLSYLVGSEARSMSLVVAVFLLGLATGYRFWGNISAKIKERQKLLKVYGYIELGIGAYAVVFPSYYKILESLAHNSPNLMLFDFLITMAAIFIPTFLMGGTIPLLTSVVPESADQVNSTHAQIYGVNTLGAVLGAFGGGFIFLPLLGLPMSLLAGGGINILVGLILGANGLKGTSQEKGDIESIPNHFGTWAIYAFVFATGCISISFELLFIRIMNLTVGSSYFVFPLVIGVFVLGLALGSLSLYRKAISLKRLFGEMIFLVAYLGLIYMLIPYWPYWMHNVRASLTTVPTNHMVFISVISIFLSVMCLPFLIPLGRLLPVGYSLISKNNKNYGDVCGRIYFMNAIGTLVGSLFIGHYLLYWLDVDQIFKVIILILGVVTFWLLYCERNFKTLGAGAVLLLAVLLLPKWDRYNHQIGLFREHNAKKYSFKEIFYIAESENKRNIIFFDDGPNTTVSVLQMDPLGDDIVKKLPSRSLFVNGKSDGSTYGDYSTVTLLATLPYLYAQPEKDLSVAVIGLGTGVTAGTLAAAEDVKDVTVLEISSTVLDTLPLFDVYTEDLSHNKKVNFVESDAFRYFTKTSKSFDIIVSEPSNPWVTGVENLYTSTFYKKSKMALNPNGIFIQWSHIYGMDNKIMATIIKNISAEFKYLKFYIIGTGDVAIIGSMEPFTGPHLERRWHQPLIERRQSVAGLYEPRYLDLLNLYSEKELRWIGQAASEIIHDIDTPTLAYSASKATFMGGSVSLPDLLSTEFARLFLDTTNKPLIDSVVYFFGKYQIPENITSCPDPVDYRRQYICARLKEYVQLLGMWKKINRDILKYESLVHYRTLRQAGMIAPDIEFLKHQASKIPSTTKIDSKIGLLVAQEFSKELQFDEARKVLEKLVTNQTISAEDSKRLFAQLERTRGLMATGLAQFNNF